MPPQQVTAAEPDADSSDIGDSESSSDSDPDSELAGISQIIRGSKRGSKRG
jgi:hypothetical protein